MTKTFSSRGGAPVGYLRELDPIESSAVTYLRLWCEGRAAQEAVVRDFETAFGPENGRRIALSFEELCNMCVHHGRRPLMRHGVTCDCLGADESCFANFIGYASEGARSDALMIAMTIVEPERAPILAGLAEEFGLALRKMRQTISANIYDRTGATFH